MRQATRITLFVQDRNGKADMAPDTDVIHLLLDQVPLVTRNPDGSRTLVFDLSEPGAALATSHRAAPPDPSYERLRDLAQAMATEARALGLILTASVVESAELVAEAEITSRAPPSFARA
jgi:hypothetical protein